MRCDEPPNAAEGGFVEPNRPWRFRAGERADAILLHWPAVSSEARAEAPSATLRAIQARNYRSLRHIDLRFEGSFHVLVGPNASGKSTLLDAIAFITDYVKGSLKDAVEKRTRNFQDLVWGRPDDSPRFELAAEFVVDGQELRYELRVEESDDGQRVVCENGYLAHLGPEEFSASASSSSIVRTSPSPKRSQVFSRDGHLDHVWFRSEGNGGKGTRVGFGDNNFSAISALLMLHGISFDDNERKMDFSTSIRATEALRRDGVQFLQLDSRALRQAASANGDDGSRLASDGGNLPRVLEGLKSDPEQWKDWLDHVRQALPGIEDIRIVRREDDRHVYLMVRRAGVEVPSWGVSEGTLRLFALTVIAYLRGHPIAYLLEEPENGIHPMAIEFAYQSLSAVYGAHVFIASHSPTLLRCVKPEQVLCFGHESTKGTAIVRGDQHPRLRDWLGSVDETVFWAADILT